jgi:hypothetical protein
MTGRCDGSGSAKRNAAALFTVAVLLGVIAGCGHHAEARIDVAPDESQSVPDKAAGESIPSQIQNEVAPPIVEARVTRPETPSPTEPRKPKRAEPRPKTNASAPPRPLSIPGSMGWPATTEPPTTSWRAPSSDGVKAPLGGDSKTPLSEAMPSILGAPHILPTVPTTGMEPSNNPVLTDPPSFGFPGMSINPPSPPPPMLGGTP